MQELVKRLKILSLNNGEFIGKTEYVLRMFIVYCSKNVKSSDILSD